MDVTIIATRGCSHCSNFAKELDGLGVAYDIQYVEDHPETGIMITRLSPHQ